MAGLMLYGLVPAGAIPDRWARSPASRSRFWAEVAGTCSLSWRIIRPLSARPLWERAYFRNSRH